MTSPMQTLGTQVLRTAYQDQQTDIKQARMDGKFNFEGGSSFGFGVETRSMESHQRASTGFLAMGDWGIADAGGVPDMVALLTPFSLTSAFDDFNPVGAPTGGWKGNADVLGQWAMAHGYTNWIEPSAADGELRYNPGFNTNSIVSEDTQSVYAQLALKFDIGGRPSNLVIGARYEDTDVISQNSQLVPTEVIWTDDNDFRVARPTVGGETLVRGDGSYHNLLPNLDFDISLSDSLKARLSYSQTIARAGYGQLAAGADTNGQPGGSILNGGVTPGNQNNPALNPLESDNLDISLEYYFSDRGYVSVGAFAKNVDNFIGETVQNINLFGIRDETSGPRAQAARDALIAGGFGTDDPRLFTMLAMMDNAGAPPFFYDVNGNGVNDGPSEMFVGGQDNYDDTNLQHVVFATQYDIHPDATDPLMIFAVTTPVNNKKAKIHGFELGGQYFFGDSGFGVLANYTIVDGDVSFDNSSDPNSNQFALLGLSDSANAVLMYEKFGFSARLAYNWRDEYLSAVNQGAWRNPIYVEAYDQIDLSLGYDFSENFAVSLEAVNLTGEDVRWHGRSAKQLWRLEDQGARYSVGARYKF